MHGWRGVMAGQPDWVPPGIDTQRANVARVYDYWLGGSHNFLADQDVARAIAAIEPNVRMFARANRAFLGRAVRHVAAAGVRQFLDIGSGIPTVGNVHEIAHDVVPDARVAYVDMDPVAVAESLEILEGNDQAIAVRADLRSPQAVDALAPGLYLVVSHAAAETYLPEADQAHITASTDQLKAAARIYTSKTTTPGMLRTRAETARFFDGLELLDPGVVWLQEWR